MTQGWRFELFDLTRPLTEETIFALLGDSVAGKEYESYRSVQIAHEQSWGEANSVVCRFALADHVGTHVDAPSHCLRGGPSVEEVKIEHLIGEAVVLDLDVGGRDHAYSAEDFSQATPRVQRGDIVLIYSGYRDCRPDDRIRQAYLSVEGARWLLERGVRAVGCEPGGLEHCWDGVYVERWEDPVNRERAWPVHQLLLANGVYIIEGLTNLEQLRGQRVRFAALPLPIPGLSGSPVRAVAWRDR